MDTKNNISLRESLKKLKLQDFVYPSVIVIFLCVTIIVFFFATQFISKNINRIFTAEDVGKAQALNLDQYKLVAKKLNIVVAEEGVPVPEETTIIAPEAATSTPVVVSLDKESITITVKNSTAKKGVAATLAKLLENDGFQKPKTGNESKLYATTTILLKESKSSYGSLLLETVHKSYPSATLATAPETNAFDATIIIGSH